MPILFTFIIALIFCFSHIRGQRAEERKAEEEFLRNEEIKHKTECEIEKSKIKMQNHPLLEAVGNRLIGTIDSCLNEAANIALSPTVLGKSLNYISIYFYSTRVEINYTEFLCGDIDHPYHREEIIKFSDFGYDCFESEYDLQIFGRYLYSKLQTHYAKNSNLVWKFRYKDTDCAYTYISIDISACHPKLKSI